DQAPRGDRPPVHQVEVVLARRGVAPQDVCLAVTVEVADPLHLPGWIHKVDGTLGGGAQPVHQPDVVLAGRGVAPQDVGFAVAVEVPGPLYLPGRIAQRGERALRDDRLRVHQPEVVFARRAIAPQDVRLAVAVEVHGRAGRSSVGG